MEPESDVQDKHGSTSLNPVHVPNNNLGVEIRTSSADVLLNKMGPSGDEHAFKVRKPYTITKQRERWTEEEHNKFLEALKLYGRAWRRIEEHIGTKTAVQIRSHAQKFFSKVVRDSTGNSLGTITPIEIPPPRPKRKPMHPYPRKLSNLSSKGAPVMQQQERSSSPPSVSDQEDGSPTSVLSGIGSSFSNFPVNCTSPNSSAAGSSPVGMLINQKEIEEQSQNASAEETRPLFEGPTTMEEDSAPEEEDVSMNEHSSVGADMHTLKLFGRTVLVTDSQKPCFSTRENSVACNNSLSSANVGSHSKNIDMDARAAGMPGQCSWRMWPGVPPMFYYLPMSGNLVGSTEAPCFPPPWWFCGGGISLSFIPPQNVASAMDAPQSCEGEDDKGQQNEGSWTGSSTASASEAGILDKGSDIVDSQTAASSLKSSEYSTFSSRNVDTDRPMRGFVPYKRCIAERDVESAQMANEEGEGRRRLRMCL